MKIPEFRVLLSQPTEDDPEATVEHVARILHGDQLRAELEAPRHALNDMAATPMHFTTLWVWASLTRTHVIEDDFRAFKPRVLAMNKVEPPDGQDDDLDPTQPAAATG